MVTSKPTREDLKKRLLDLKNLKFEVRETMRYDDVGDYFDDTIVAYDFKDDVITNAIFLHEFIEYTLIKSAGIDPALIDRFDTDKKAREEHPREYDLYGKFHDMANVIERQFIENLGMSWTSHDKTIFSAKVNVAVQELTDRLHNHKPEDRMIEHAKRVVSETLAED